MTDREFTDRLSEILMVDADEDEFKSAIDLQAAGYLSSNAGLVVETKNGTVFLLNILRLK